MAKRGHRTKAKAGKHCSKTKYRAAFRRNIKKMSFATAVRASWRAACGRKK